MFNRKSELINYLFELSKIYQSTVSSTDDLLTGSYKNLSDSVTQVSSQLDNGELLVPIIGGFSAGKSSALNSLIGEDVLPVAITQETAIPAELRYSTSEYIVAVTTTGNEERYEIAQITELTGRAESISYLRVYLNSDALKRVAPYILVDMPGFDSPVKSHNDSILRYLARGVHYLYLVDATAGTLKSDEVRRLNEVEDMGRGFNIFLTKKDLFSDHDLVTVTEHIEDQVSVQFASDQPVTAIDKNSAEPLLERLLSLDPNVLFDNMHIGAVKEIYYTANADLNTALNALKKSKSEKEEALSHLKNILQNIKNKKEEAVSSADIDHSAAARILQSIDRELNRSVEELSNSFNSPDALNRKVTDIVRSLLIRELQQVTQAMSHDISNSLVNDSNINLNVDLNLDSGWLPNLVDDIRGNVMNSLMNINDQAGSKKADVGGTLGGIALMVQNFIPHPVIKVVLAILPGVVSMIFGSVSDSQKKEQVKESLRAQVFPDILRQVEPELQRSLMNVRSAIAQSLSSEFEEKIVAQQGILNQAESEFEITNGENNKKIESIANSILNLDVLTESVLFKG